jgi:tRNA nucleotidyltransferase (CCA-adding enzyme)
LSAVINCWMVGGAVRDELLGLPVYDRDWVVIGSTPEALIDAGYLPVGKDFPVFLHPVTREEVALARTERKTAPGYHGFSFHANPDVTLEQDLARRDLTINAMARAPDGTLVDPYGGQRDLQAKVLRHVSSAFSEDPVRILRLARFAARFTEFSVAPETQILMQRMVAQGEVDALVSERVWQELARGLMQERPSRMLEVLRACGALAKLLPEVQALWGVPQPAEHHPEVDTGVHVMMVLDQAARMNARLDVRFACLGHDLGKATTRPELWPRHLGHEDRSEKLVQSLSERLRVPTECKELAQAVAREHGHVHRSLGLNAKALLRLLERCDALRRPERFAHLLQACECDARGRLGLEHTPYPQRMRLQQALNLALAVNTASVAKACAEKNKQGPAVGRAIRACRQRAIQTGLT